ncbi:hypothetical protein CRG98_005874 [Punica granatum]|uniref:Uncharacterized protein n=1 Tax=Punica granatum TaxID=22663 RepID=A0A2I0KZ46_PUNGR|nr:hypothetical protein CRG98_005874 [Punica granatum]
MGLCSGEGPIRPGVSLDLGGDARIEVERFVRLSLSSTSWGGHALFVGAVTCDLLWKEGWDSVLKFQGAGREVFIVLIVWESSLQVVVGRRVPHLSATSRKDSSGTQADSMDCCRRRVEGLHGGIARCMVRCYRDRALYGWGLPTQGCEFLEIERGSLGAGLVA